MDDVDPKFGRLLRAAAKGSGERSPEAPFGFDTRVVALWRAGEPAGANGLIRLLRRVALTAVSVILIASAAAVYELNQDSDTDELFGDEFAIADSAIQNEILQ
jgi:hypothetical protein